MRRIWIAVLALAVLGLPAGDAAAAGTIELKVLSNRADLVSGGDALIEVVTSGDIQAADVSMAVGGQDVTEAFSDRGGRRIGLVTGLATGPNEVIASAAGAGAKLVVTNHAIGGPIFSGPQVQPWVCATEDAGLGPSLDAQCNAPTVFDYQYWSTESEGFAAYDPDNPPTDVATVTTEDNRTVPYIVRRETGALNRGVHAIAVLWDPANPGLQAWNHKLFYPFGASCNTNYHQGAVPGVMNNQALSQGFAVATSSLNVLGQNCNTVTSAET